ncbi:MAG: hypothetical protein IH621_07845 [Krumholzibacteria bacterium]|nr:hypothetical protein [Candidatus Krumholzibacteria bacterium]
MALIALSAASPLAASAEQEVSEIGLEPLWRIDSGDSTAPLLGFVSDVAIDASGDAYLLDGQLADVKVMAPDGRLLRVLGRSGDGPGEFRAPGEVFFLPDSSLAVVSKMGGLIKRIDHVSGLEIGTFRLNGAVTDGVWPAQVLSLPASSPQEVVGLVSTWTGSGYGMRLALGALVLPDGSGSVQLRRHLLEVGEYQDEAREEECFYLLWTPWTVDSLGRIVAAPYWDDYEVRWIDARGVEVQRVRFDFPHRPRAAADKRRLLALWGGTDPQSIIGLRLRYADNETVVRQIIPRPDGVVWIRTSRQRQGDDSRVFTEFDAIGPMGDRLGRIRLLGPGDDETDLLFADAGDVLVIVHGGDGAAPWQRPPGASLEGPPYVIAAYRMRPPAR